MQVSGEERVQAVTGIAEGDETAEVSAPVESEPAEPEMSSSRFDRRIGYEGEQLELSPRSIK